MAALTGWQQHASIGTTMLIPGSCHCGNIVFELSWQPEPTEIPARACTCSFCVKHGGVWTSCPTGSLIVTIHDPEQVSAYNFGTRTADFHVCSRCGVVPVVTSRIGGQLYAVVSTNAFGGPARQLLRPSPASFDAEDEPTRLNRRAYNWISNVHFVGSRT
jgi:hypothetical protein